MSTRPQFTVVDARAIAFEAERLLNLGWFVADVCEELAVDQELLSACLHAVTQEEKAPRCPRGFPVHRRNAKHSSR